MIRRGGLLVQRLRIFNKDFLFRYCTMYFLTISRYSHSWELVTRKDIDGLKNQSWSRSRDWALELIRLDEYFHEELTRQSLSEHFKFNFLKEETLNGIHDVAGSVEAIILEAGLRLSKDYKETGAVINLAIAVPKFKRVLNSTLKVQEMIKLFNLEIELNVEGDNFNRWDELLDGLRLRKIKIKDFQIYPYISRIKATYRNFESKQQELATLKELKFLYYTPPYINVILGSLCSVNKEITFGHLTADPLYEGGGKSCLSAYFLCSLKVIGKKIDILRDRILICEDSEGNRIELRFLKSEADKIKENEYIRTLLFREFGMTGASVIYWEKISEAEFEDDFESFEKSHQQREIFNNAFGLNGAVSFKPLYDFAQQPYERYFKKQEDVLQERLVFRAGERIKDDQLGIGTIVNSWEEDGQTKLLVVFEKVGYREVNPIERKLFFL